MSARFDRHVIVDWSARAEPSPSKPAKDSVWIGIAGEGEEYFRTRAAAVSWLTDWLDRARSAGQRVLVGFDFPFGYPRGFARALTGQDTASAIWAHLAERISDGPNNANNRYEVAAGINRALPGAGPFWGCPAGRDLDGLSPLKWDRATIDFAEFRLSETAARGAKSCWQLNGAGSVGGQTLMGLPVLHRLRARFAPDLAVWPFDTGFTASDAPIVLAEVYPALLSAEVAADARAGEVADAAQVRVMARAFAALDAGGGLVRLLGGGDLDAQSRAIARREEGWILGVGAEDALRAAASGAPLLRNDCFALPPGVDWVPMDAALAQLRATLGAVAEVETVELAEACGRVLAAPLRAARAHPPYANSAVDGYGFAHDALRPAAVQDLPLAPGRAAAGGPFAGVVPEGHAVRILTGAMVPAGVDTVVLDEDVTRTGARIRFGRGLKRGANTRKLGEDVAAGAEMLGAGHLLMPQDLALAGAAGLGAVAVRRRLRVAVLSTGDEVRPAGAQVAAHQIHDANRPMLLGILARWGMVPVDLGQAADRPDAVASALERGAQAADAILTTGGASAGDEDHLAACLKARGTLATWRIAIKPGRPLALGLWAGKPVFGLPGNPVAAFVCALIFARPALGLLAGRPWAAPEGLMLPAAFAKAKKAGRREYLRARLTAEGRVEVFASEGSGRVSGLSWARGLVELEDGAREVAPGDPVRYLPFAAFGL